MGLYLQYVLHPPITYPLPIVTKPTFLGAGRCNFERHLLCTGIFACWKSFINPPGCQIVSTQYQHFHVYIIANSFCISLNILVAQGGEQAKLGDFGFAPHMPEHDSCRTLVTAPIIAQTNGYGPPEVQSGKFSRYVQFWNCKLTSSSHHKEFCGCMHKCIHIHR